MHYVIGRDLDGDGLYEYIQDMDNMILTEDIRRALQFTKTELSYIDMEYLSTAGFYAFEAPSTLPLLEALLFRPTRPAYRPRAVLPPRRVIKPRPPRPRGPVGHVVVGPAPRPPRPVGPRPVGPAARPAPRGPVVRPAAPGPRPAGPGPKGPNGGPGPRGGGRGPGR